MIDTPRLALPHIAAGQALKHITHNEAIQRLDALVQPIVVSRSVGTPPVAPLDGEAYVVSSGATGSWAGHTDEIAVWQANAWTFFDPAEGFQVFDCATDSLCIFSGSAWVAVASFGAGLLQQGINTSADSTNRLAVSAAATLLSHEGAGHQLKLNKAASGDTASLLFQSNWSGRAEMGLMGDNAWRIKVSADGSTWTNALTVASDGTINIGGALRPAADNTHSLGASGARWSAVWSATGVIQTSDSRFKTDILPSDLGLDFILALNPVRYRWQETSDEAVHYGLLAQNVAEVAARCGVKNFGGHVLVDGDDPDSQQALRYSSFIAPLISAVQTLAQRVAALESRL